jgi:HEAT repeat protein
MAHPREKKAKPPIAALIKRVIRDTSASLSPGSAAVQELAAQGSRAVGPVLKAMRGPVAPGQHARGMVEALTTVLSAIAARDAAPLIDVLERNAAPADPELTMLTAALADGRKEQVVDPLVRALKHPSAVVRWSAAFALVRLRSARAIQPLAAALRDRSPMVQGEIVEAMNKSAFYRTALAVEPLARIVRNQRTKKHWPGLWQSAQTLLAKLRSEL